METTNKKPLYTNVMLEQMYGIARAAYKRAISK